MVTWHAARRLPRPLIVASAAGWALVAAEDPVPSLAPLCLIAATVSEATTTRVAAALAVTTPLALVLAWAAMLLAMMPPLLAPPLLHVSHRSLTRRRVRAVALFVFAYAVVWFAAGTLLAAWAVALGSLARAAGLPPLALATLLAAAWQATPLKQISLNRCHSLPPLSAFGFRADADALRYGADHAVWCVGACWAFMLLPLAADDPLHWIVMGAVTLVALVERVRAPAAARWGAACPRLPLPWSSSRVGSTA